MGEQDMGEEGIFLGGLVAGLLGDLRTDFWGIGGSFLEGLVAVFWGIGGSFFQG